MTNSTERRVNPITADSKITTPGSYFITAVEHLRKSGEIVKQATAPIRYLHGLQPVEGYSREEIRRTKKAYEAFGNTYVTDNPIITCVIPSIDGRIDLDGIYPGFPYDWIILDGHHRVRFGPKYGIVEFPTDVLTPIQAAAIFSSESNKFIKLMQKQTRDVIASFSQAMQLRNSRQATVSPIRDPQSVFFANTEGDFLQIASSQSNEAEYISPWEEKGVDFPKYWRDSIERPVSSPKSQKSPMEQALESLEAVSKEKVEDKTVFKRKD